MRKLIWMFLIGLWMAHSTVYAQTYPSRPIRIIVPSTPGAAVDFTARLIGQRLTDTWGQQMVIDNRSGAGGIIAHELASKAIPDGYTLIFSTSAGLVINPLLSKVPYRFFPRLRPDLARVDQSADALRAPIRAGGERE